jgi:hypothetical protein
MHQLFLSIVAAGYAVLVGAIILNVLATMLGIMTWYGFLESVSTSGWMEALRHAGIFSTLYLFVFYPLLLGWMAQTAMRWVQ